MNTIKKTIFLLLALFMVLPIQSLLNSKEAGAATSGVPPAACTRTLTGTSSVPKVTLSPKPLDLVFILDASGSFTANMSTVKAMINQSIDKFVRPANGDRTMITTFQGVDDNMYDGGLLYEENNYKITTNSSKLTSNITEVKNFVNAVTPNGGTPTPNGITQAVNDYKSVAGTNVSNRQTVFVLITDGVVNVNPLTADVEKTSSLEQQYIDYFKSVSTYQGQVYDNYLGVYYSQYRWTRYNPDGTFNRYEYLRDYPGTRNDTYLDSAAGGYQYIVNNETSQDWKARLNDLKIR